MTFIGVIASSKCFKNIKQKIKEEIQENTINLIHINNRSIENIKNIKFETIIIEDKIEKFESKMEILEKIFENIQYLIVNTDINQINEQINKVPNIVTYGLNQKANITVSSVSDTDILIYCQKNLMNKKGNKIEIEERRIQKKQNKGLKIYEMLILYAIFKIYQKENYNFFE